MIVANVKHCRAFINLGRLTKDEKKLVDTIPNGFFIQTTNANCYPFTLIFWRRMLKLFGEHIVWGGDEKAIAEMREWAQRFSLAHEYRDAETLPDVPGEVMPSWRHQQRGYWFAYHMRNCVLSEQMGAGKTKQAIDKFNNSGVKKALVVTTASAVDDWPKHIAKHGTKPWHVLILDKRSGANATIKAEKLTKAFFDHEYLIVVVSYDSVYRPPLGRIIKNRRGGGGDIGVLAKLGFDIIIADEIQAISDPMSRRSLFVWKLGDRIPQRLGMSGTVIRQSPENVFGIYRFIDSALFGIDYAAYMDRYCVFNRPADHEILAARNARTRGEFVPEHLEKWIDSPPEFRRTVVSYKRLDELGRMMATLTYHVDGVNLDLPQPIHIPKRCFLSMKAQRVYNDLEDEFRAVLDDGTEIETDNKLTQMLRLEQCAGGHIGKPIIDPETGETDFVEIHEVDDTKEQLLEETLRELDPDEPAIVVCRFRHDLAVIKRVALRCGRKYREQSGAKKQRVLWQDETGGAILGAQIQSACEAIDLTRSHYMVLYSIGFSLYQYEQMLARIDRPGQTRRPTYVHLIAAGTVDEKKYAALERRKHVVNQVVGYMKEKTFARMVAEESLAA